MKTKSYATVALAAALAIGKPAPAQPAEVLGLTLAQQQNCMSCHAVSHPLLGPALHEVASRYATRSDAAAYLAHKIIDGSSGDWGAVPMPANTQLTADQAAILASWILTLK